MSWWQHFWFPILTKLYWLRITLLPQRFAPDIVLVKVLSDTHPGKTIAYAYVKYAPLVPRSFAMVGVNGDRVHRIGKPASYHTDGTRIYWKDGMPHRNDGPACYFKTGEEHFAINGRLVEAASLNHHVEAMCYEACNPKTSGERLKQLQYADDVAVAYLAAHNPNATDADVAEFFLTRNDELPRVGKILLQSRKP